MGDTGRIWLVALELSSLAGTGSAPVALRLPGIVLYRLAMRRVVGCVGTVGARLDALGRNSMWLLEKRRVRHERREISTTLFRRAKVGGQKAGTLCAAPRRSRRPRREPMSFIEMWSSCIRAAPTTPDDDRGILRSEVGWPREQCPGVSDTSGG